MFCALFFFTGLWTQKGERPKTKTKSSISCFFWGFLFLVILAHVAVKVEEGEGGEEGRKIRKTRIRLEEEEDLKKKKENKQIGRKMNQCRTIRETCRSKGETLNAGVDHKVKPWFV